MMLRRVNICSVHERSFLNPACLSRWVQYTASCSLFSSTLLKTLPGVESSVIPRQLLQCLRLPFCGSLIITPFFQSSVTSKSCHIMLNSSANCSANAVAYLEYVLLTWDGYTTAPITFCWWTKVHQFFFVKRGSDGGRANLFTVVDVLIRSEDILDQTLKLFKNARTVDFG